MSLFGQTKRHTPPFTPKGRRSPLPLFAGADEKRFHPSSSTSSASGIFTTVYLPLPSFRLGSSSSGSSSSHRGGDTYHDKPPHRRYIRICLPIPPRVYARLPRLSRAVRALLGLLALLALVILVLGFRRRPGGGGGWSPPFSEPDSTVLTPEEVAAIWEWEVLSGHHPSIQQREYPRLLPYVKALSRCYQRHLFSLVTLRSKS